MNFCLTILEEFIAGMLVNMATAFAKRKIARKKRQVTNGSTLMNHFEEKFPSYRVSNDPLIANLTAEQFYANANLLHLVDTCTQKKGKEELIKKCNDENENSITKYLPNIDEKLLRLWNGAMQAYDSNNLEKARHFMCSIRELFTHFLHILAPDNDMKKWTSDPSYFYHGMPTRKSRFEYILRNLKSNRFVELKKNEIKAAIEFIIILQEGTHSLESEFTASDLVIIKSKAEATIKFLLDIELQVNREKINCV